jgi:hypothetical protein
MAERGNTEAILSFLRDTKVGRLLAHDEIERLEEERRLLWGWDEEVREETPDQTLAEPELGGGGEE